ncbi:hypothetical protein Tco_0475674 [Tanacetum coccineum]
MTELRAPRVPIPHPEDPYEAIRQAYLVENETPESPHTIESPTPLPYSTPPMRHAKDSVDLDTSSARSTPSDSTALLSSDHPLTHASPTLVPILCRTTHMVVRVPHTMSPGLSASIAEAVAMADLAFLEDDEEEEDDDDEEEEEEEDEEIEKSLDSDSKSEDTEDEGLTIEDEDPATGDEGLDAGDEGPGIRVKSLGLGGDTAIPEGQQRAAPVVETAMGEPLGLGYGALRRQEITLGEGRMPSVFEVGQSSRFVPEPKRPERVSALRQPTLATWIDLEDDRVYIDVLAYPPPV